MRATGEKTTAFFKKAKNNLKAAQICFDCGLYDACTNRAYSSAFQAAVAVFAKFVIKREKLDHGWVQAEFSVQLI